MPQASPADGGTDRPAAVPREPSPSGGSPVVDVRQSAFTAIVDVHADRVDPLRRLLRGIGDKIRDNPRIDFSRLQSVHFMRWAVLPAQEDLRGREIPPRLLLATNHDGPRTAHLDELIDVGGDALREIYGHCVGFPGADAPGREVRNYLLRHRRRAAAFYVGAVGESVLRVHREERLRDALAEYLDRRHRQGDPLPDDPVAAHRALRDHVRERTDLAWALEPEPRPGVGARIAFWSGAAGRIALALLLLALLGAGAMLALDVLVPLDAWRRLPGPVRGLSGLVVALGAAALYLRLRERLEAATDRTSAAAEHVQELAAREDFQVQNQMTSIALVKAGPFRQLVLRSVLGLVDSLARYVYRRGSLGSITSIHFARWVIIDGGRNLLFLSNYDGSWESYLGDFIDKASDGLTAIWSNTHRFPRSRWLIGGGARQALPFKAKVRASQVPTEVWYSAYADLSVQNVLNNAAIRRGLAAEPGREEARAWLARL